MRLSIIKLRLVFQLGFILNFSLFLHTKLKSNVEKYLASYNNSEQSS